MHFRQLLVMAGAFLCALDQVVASTYECQVSGEAVYKNWAPSSFVMNFEPDLTEIVSPVGENFGAKPFKKGFLGSSLWSRGRGKTRSGMLYNYQWQMDFSPRTGDVVLQIEMQGYHPMVAKGSCFSESGRTSSLGDSSGSWVPTVGIIETKSSSGARASFSSDLIQIDFTRSEWLRETVQEVRRKFGSYERIKVIELAIQRPTSKKGYGAYDWRDAETVNAQVIFKAGEIIIKADEVYLANALEFLKSDDSVQVGINTGRGWATQEFFKMRSSWN